ncbi:MAG: hypothetical protein M0R47_13445 [Methylobacter sp.]|jgi:hypothetical protein|uniref:hypothetical protein n=1 Tax=Methylobacter sp. TaxID=2051955 RepID=UPI0025F44597|nr:hypothetical protein [Methylobacter sp.]MCK9621527.1 hypothetical protein [Methylobacter sp.]
MKTKKCSEEFISCLGSNYNQPIANLVAGLLAVPLPDFPDEPPRNNEVDYAISLVVLLVLDFEAWISRARYLFNERVLTKNDMSVISWLKSLNQPKMLPIIERLSEIYFLRDAIVHNHIWTYKQIWIEGRVRYSGFNIDSKWQTTDNKFKNIVNGTLPLSSFPRSKKLNLIVIPSFVGRREVVAVFKTVKDTLKILEELGYIEIVHEISHVRFDGKLSFPFWRLIGVIQRSFLVKPQATS